MNPLWRPIIERHYCYPYEKVKQKAFKEKVIVTTYWKYLGLGKNYIHAYMSISKDLRKEAKSDRAIYTQNSHENHGLGLASP